MQVNDLQPNPNGFGAVLRQLREDYPERIGREHPRTARAYMKLSASGLIECLRAHDVPISSGRYSEIENNNAFPPDPKRFLTAVKEALELSDKEAQQLRFQLAFDLIRLKLDLDVDAATAAARAGL